MFRISQPIQISNSHMQMNFFEFEFKCEMQFICELFKFWKFISRVLQIRKMQIIC